MSSPATSPKLHHQLAVIIAKIVTVIILLGLLGTAADASAAELKAPLTIDYLALTAALKTQIYTGPGGRAEFWQGDNSCQYLVGENPRLGRDPHGALALTTDATLALGLPIAGQCISPVTWSGLVKLDAAAYVAGLTLRLRITDINLYNLNGSKSLLVGHGFDLIKGNIIPKLETFSFDLHEPIRNLESLFDEALPPNAASNLHSALATLRLEPQVIAETDGLRVTLAMVLPPAAAPITVSGPAAPLTPAEITAWQTELDNWDAFLVFAIEQVGLTLPNQQVRDQLFNLLMDSRYRLVQALMSPQAAGGPDPIRLLFLYDWTQLRSIIKAAAPTRAFGNRTLQFLSFISAGDALFAFDQAAPALGVRISANDLRRLARIMAPQVTADPLNFTFREDPSLQQLFGIPQPLAMPGPLPEGDTIPPAGLAPSPALSPAPASTSLLSLPTFLLKLPEAFALENPPAPPQLIALGRTLTPVVVDSGNVSHYQTDLNQLLTLTAKGADGVGKLNSPDGHLFLLMVKSVAWQESCWRQFIRLGSRVTYLESSTGDIGLMQVNKHVWRGFYSLPHLEWDIVYNASAGSDILERLMQSQVNRQASNRPGTAEAIARSTYSAYNGGPAAWDRWRMAAEPSALKQIDDTFWDKFRVTASGQSFNILQCAACWTRLH